MIYNNFVTLERLKQVVTYNPDTGVFRWLLKRKKCTPGNIAGSLRPTGYISIFIDGVPYQAHRLAIFYMTGEWPASDVDHKSLNKSDNTWSEIRPATRGQNLANTKRRTDNASGYKGVTFLKAENRWKSEIQFNGKRYFLGRFNNPETAHAAYVAAARKHFGEYANPG